MNNPVSIPPADRPEARALARSILDHLPNAIFWVRPEGQIWYANPAAVRLLGHEPHALLALNIRDIELELSASAWAARWQVARRGQPTTSATQFRIATGGTLTCSVQIHHLIFSDQEFLSILVCQDTEAANSSRNAFLTEAGHELRTPLNAILGFARLMTADSTLSGQSREHLSIITRNAEHLLELINEMSALSRRDANRHIKLSAEPLSPAVPARRVVGLVPGQPAYRILVADDHDYNRLLVVRWMQWAGFEVREARNGAECIQVWKDWKPHLILMDMRMPDMDGAETARRIRAAQDGKPVAIVALTADALGCSRAAPHQYGFDDVLAKPFMPEALFEKMSRHLGIRFVYQGEADAPTAELEQSHSVADLMGAAKLPSRVCSALTQAALELDAQATHAAIAMIDPDGAALAGALTGLVEQYRFDQILALLQTEASHKHE